MGWREKFEEIEFGELKDDIIAFLPLVVVFLAMFNVIPSEWMVPALIISVLGVFVGSFLYEAKLIMDIAPLNPTHMILFFDEKHSKSFNTCFENVEPISVEKRLGRYAYRLHLKFPFKAPDGKLYRVIDVVLPDTFKKTFEPCAYGKFDVRGTKVKLSYTIFVGKVLKEYEEPEGPRLLVKAISTPITVKWSHEELKRFLEENKDIINILQARVYSLEHALEGERNTRIELESVVDDLKKSAGTLAVEYHEIASIYPSKIENKPVKFGIAGVLILLVFIILMLLGVIHFH